MCIKLWVQGNPEVELTLMFTFIVQICHQAEKLLNEKAKKLKKEFKKKNIKQWLQESVWYKTQISSLSVTMAEPYCLYPTCSEISPQLKLFIGCSCSVRRPIFLCCLILSHSIFHGFKESQGWISLYSLSGAWYLCDPTRWFFFSLSAFPIQQEDNPKLRGTTVVQVSYSKKKKKKKWIPSWTSWQARRPGDLLRGQSVCGNCCTPGQHVFGKLWFSFFFLQCSLANAYVGRSSSLLGVVMGHFLWPFLYVQTNSCKQMERMMRQTALETAHSTVECVSQHHLDWINELHMGWIAA